MATPTNPGRGETRKLRSMKNLLLPELVVDVEGSWTIIPTILDGSKINKQDRQAYVPPAYTQAQQLARLHELAHGRNSPTNWMKVRTHILSIGDELHINLDSDAVLRLAKMLEESRIDWWLWAECRDFEGDPIQIDMRPARESLNYGAMKIPDDNLLDATCQVLQLAWTVWGSQGLWHDTIDAYPEARELAPAVKEYFDACWSIVCSNRELAMAVMQAVALMCTDPTDEARDQATFELAQYFLKEEQDEEPEPTPEEKELQEEAEQEELEEQEAIEEDRTGGDHNGIQTFGHWQLHDHTVGRRRPTVRIRKRNAPVDLGTVLKYPHRYSLDRMVFGRKLRQTGSLMIDLSGSMAWTNDDLLFVLNSMPQMWVMGYFGVKNIPGVHGRICIFAKEGRFNEYTGLEKENSGGNDIDAEALAYLARLPEPRFWLSDGGVWGGILQGQPHPELPDWTGGFSPVGRIIYECNRTMKRHNILRIAEKEDMVRLFQKKRVTLYKSCTFSDKHMDELAKGQNISPAGYRRLIYHDSLPTLPIGYQL